MATDVRTLVKTDPAAARRAAMKLAIGAGVLVLLVVVSVFSVFRFIQNESAREIQGWQTRLAIVADSRQAAVQEWLEDQFAVLSGLARNQSLQLYLTLLTQSGDDYSAMTGDPAEIGYLRNLLVVTAERTGFASREGGDSVAANVQKVGLSGLALLDSSFKVVVATDTMPPVEGTLLSFLQSVPAGERGLYDIRLGDGETPVMGFAAPVFAVQEGGAGSQQIGTILGVKEVAAELYPRLVQPGAAEKTAEALLVRTHEASVEYLSPQLDGEKPLKRTMARNTPELAESFAMDTPGGFAIKRDYRDKEVLVISRRVAGSPWTLLYKVDREEALANSEERLQRLMVMFLMAIGIIVAAILAVWWKGSSLRASESADKFEKLAQRFQNQRDFMHLVTDSQPNAIAILDENARYRWFNETARLASGLARENLFNKTASDILGPVEGKKLEGWVKECLAKSEPLHITHERTVSGPEGSVSAVYHSDLIPLPARDDMPPGVLMVSQDITESVREREKRARNMNQLVQALVALVDQRDAFAADHSRRVGIVSRAIAGEIGLDGAMVEVAAFAGSLLNLGKILVPAEILTKKGFLSDKETEIVRKGLRSGTDLIANIEFDGPVVETLRQAQEAWEEKSATRFVDDSTLVTARIIVVANAFVTMASPRAFRPALSLDDALKRLGDDAGRLYDRRIVTALANYVENRGGRAEWADFATMLPAVS